MDLEVAEEQILGSGRGVERQEGDLAPALHAGQRHVLLHLVDELLPVLERTLDVGERMLGIGEVPRVVVPGGDQLLRLELSIRALRVEKPDYALAADAVADDANEWLLGQRDADCGQGGGKAGIAGGGGGKVGYGVHLGISGGGDQDPPPLATNG